MIYRCEKNYMRRRLQESFHISPSGGTMNTHLSGVNGNGAIPSISVSVQTEPMMSLNGNGHLAANLANTSSLLANGHLKANGGATSGDRQPYSSGRFKSNWIGCVL